MDQRQSASMLRNTVVSKWRMKQKKGRSFGHLILKLTMLLMASHIGVSGQNDATVRNGSVLCYRVAKNHDFLFITHESEPRKIKARRNTILLRLHNNSTCTVVITSASGDKFRKPLPDNPTLEQILNREIEYELPDDVLVPDLQYKYNAAGKERNGIAGDSFFGFYLLPKRSILFEVSKQHLGGRGVGNSIAVPFQYDWEVKDQTGNIYPSVENRVLFWTDSLPSKQ